MNDSMVIKPSIQNLSDPIERGKRVLYIRKHLAQLSREAFCMGALDVVPQTLKYWELGYGGGLTENGVRKIVKRAEELNIYCTATWLLHGIGRQATYFTEDLELSESAVSSEEHIAKELLLFREQPNSIDTIISDDAMIPLFYPGNYVGGIITNNIELAIGKECIIADDKNNLYVRILKHGDETGRYSLLCLNTVSNFAKQEIKNIKINLAAPIVWIRKANPKNNF